MTYPFIVRWTSCVALGLLTLMGTPAWAVYSCSVSATSIGMLYVGSNVDANGTATLTCTRAGTDANTLSYRLKADNGLNFDGNRRVRLNATADYLRYSLSRGTVAGGAATCQDSSTWFAPATGTVDVITGTLNFGAALTQSVTWGYCLRVRVGSGGNPNSPTAGVYTDNVNIFAQYPNNDGGALTAPATITYQMAVSNQCVFNSFPATMNFSYTSFSPAPQVIAQAFNLLCSNALPWSVAVSPASATALGLNYTIAPSPASGTGTGNNQAVTLTGTIPANQSGTCATANCTVTQNHTVTITY